MTGVGARSCTGFVQGRAAVNEALAGLDAASARILSLDMRKDANTRVQKAIRQAAVGFIQAHVPRTEPL